MILLFEILIGILTGFCLGLIPNLHLNSLAYFFLISGLFLKLSNYPYFFISFALTHTLVSFIPLCLLGVPSSENILHLFPTHKLFLKGEAKFSILLCLVGSFYGVFISILFLPLLYLLFDLLSTYNFFIYICLIIVLIYFIFSEKDLISKFVVLSIIIFSGSLGVLTLSFNYFSFDPLLVCIYGLFALPYLILNIFKSNRVVIQKLDVLKIKSFKLDLPLIFLSVFSSLFIMLVPSFSTSQAALLVSKIKSKLKSIDYIPLFSAITISSIVFSLFLGIFFNKSRLGFVNILITNISSIRSVDIYLFLSVIIFSTCISILFILFIIDKIILFINKINYRLLNVFVIMISFIIIFITSRWIGLLFLGFSCLVGSLPLVFNKNRVILMAYIIVPTLIYYIF